MENHLPYKTWLRCSQPVSHSTGLAAVMFGKSQSPVRFNKAQCGDKRACQCLAVLPQSFLNLVTETHNTLELPGMEKQDPPTPTEAEDLPTIYSFRVQKAVRQKQRSLSPKNIGKVRGEGTEARGKKPDTTDAIALSRRSFLFILLRNWNCSNSTPALFS